jgi:hypothetical protein
LNITELNTALSQVREAMAERDRIARELERAERSLAEERSRLAELSASLQKEDDDVRQLERASLVGLFYAVLGSKEERLDQERQELLAAKLKYDNSQRRVSSLERDADELRFRLNRLSGPRQLQERHDSLLAEKERLLKEQASPVAARLVDLSAEQSSHPGRRAGEVRAGARALGAGKRQQLGHLGYPRRWDDRQRGQAFEAG